MNHVRVVTKGSVWLFDEDRKMYCRFPRDEKPRERPEWGSAEAGVLQDAVWHSYAAWRIERVAVAFDGFGLARAWQDELHIDIGHGWSYCIRAPQAALEAALMRSHKSTSSGSA